MIISENRCQFLVNLRSYVEISVMHACQWLCVRVYQTMTSHPSIEFIPQASAISRPVPTASNSRAYLGRDSERDPNKRDYFYFHVWGQKSRDY